MNDNHDALRIRLGDLPDGLFDQVVAEVQHFAVPLIVNNYFIGSGVLVQIDNVPGILTVEHVVNNRITPFDNSLESQHALVTCVSEKANVVAIEMRNLTWWTTQPQTKDWGPDLAFIRLPEVAGFTSQLRSSKIFYSLTLETENRMKEALDESGFMTLVGYLNDQITDAPGESGFQDVRQIQGYAFLTGPEERHDQNGFDYVDVGCNRILSPAVPKNFRGVSGGGLWRFNVFTDVHEKVGRETLGGSFLAGVVFLEIGIETCIPRVRCHGARSIYEVFLPQVRDWLKSS
jgi:hypothetical protein